MEKEYIIAIVSNPFFQKKGIEDLLRLVLPEAILFKVNGMEELKELSKIVYIDVAILVEESYHVLEMSADATFSETVTKYLVFAKKTNEILVTPEVYCINQRETENNILTFIKGVLFKIEPRIKKVA